jgi:restriction system protein
MAIPDYQTLMLPLLKRLADGKEHKHSRLVDELGSEFGLTGEELSERVPSGTQKVFLNRVGWARTYLKKAGSLDSGRNCPFRCAKKMGTSDPTGQRQKERGRGGELTSQPAQTKANG